ncbi:hypothetical protein [Stieleria sp.]|uniref:hypothetical protein n=1 Tax=Stieleria sp. TaxID=2795976 RepID=UPI003563D57A
MSGLNRKSSVAHGSETNARKFVRNLTVTLYGLVFVASAFLVTRWQLVDDGGLLFVAFVLSQCSMIALWAADYRGHTAISCAAITFFSILCWWIIARFRFVGFGDASEICWVIVVATQAVATITGATCIDTFSKSSRRKYSDRIVHGVQLRRLSFGIGNLILWTTFVAIGLLIVRQILYANGWTADLPGATQTLLAILMGLCGAAIAVMWLATFRGAIWTVVAQRSLIWFPVFLFGTLFFHMLLAYLQKANFIQPTKTVVPLVGQYVLSGWTLLATLNHTRR